MFFHSESLINKKKNAWFVCDNNYLLSELCMCVKRHFLYLMAIRSIQIIIIFFCILFFNNTHTYIENCLHLLKYKSFSN